MDVVSEGGSLGMDVVSEGESLGMDVVSEGGSIEKDLRLRVSETREEFWKERSDNLSLDVRGGRERQRWSEERVLIVGLMLRRLRR